MLILGNGHCLFSWVFLDFLEIPYCFAGFYPVNHSDGFWRSSAYFLHKFRFITTGKTQSSVFDTSGLRFFIEG